MQEEIGCRVRVEAGAQTLVTPLTRERFVVFEREAKRGFVREKEGIETRLCAAARKVDKKGYSEGTMDGI